MPVHQATQYGGHPTERLLTINDVAELLAVSRDTVYRLVRSGELSSLRVGERLRFHPAELAAYLDRNRDPVGS